MNIEYEQKQLTQLKEKRKKKMISKTKKKKGKIITMLCLDFKFY